MCGDRLQGREFSRVVVKHHSAICAYVHTQCNSASQSLCKSTRLTTHQLCMCGSLQRHNVSSHAAYKLPVQCDDGIVLGSGFMLCFHEERLRSTTGVAKSSYTARSTQ